MTFRRRAFSTSALRLTGLALLAAALAGCAHAGKGEAPGSGIRFVSDDFAGALARARAEGKPLFVDAWAPWCHSCVSMKSYVFPDAVLSGVADRYVWLEVDTEKPVNRAFVEQFPTEALPTLMVIDPRTGQAFRRWVGSATVVELAARLRSTALALTPGAPGAPAQSALARASAADATGEHAAATAAYREALATSVPRSLDHAEAVEGLVQRLAQDGDTGGCVELAREELSHVAPGTALATLVATGLSCALELDELDARRAATLGALENRVASLARDPSVVLMADDRSSLFETEEGARRARGDLAGARATALRWTAFLEEEAGRAGTPGGPGGVRLAPALGLPRARRARAGHPRPGAERPRLPERLQPSGPPGGRVSGHARAVEGARARAASLVAGLRAPDLAGPAGPGGGGGAGGRCARGAGHAGPGGEAGERASPGAVPCLDEHGHRLQAQGAVRAADRLAPLSSTSPLPGTDAMTLQLLLLLLAAEPTEPPKPVSPLSEMPAKFTPGSADWDHERREVMIPMRDGVKLFTVILVPRGAKNAPMLLTRTPYDADKLTRHQPSVHLGPLLQGYDNATDVIVEGGYIRVVQDVRGKHGSEGDYVMNRPLRGPLNPTPVDHATDT